MSISGIQSQNTYTALSSGYKINSAADDAAGLAISEKLLSQTNGYDVGSSNAKDGISLINTMLGMRIDLKTKKPVIANKMGGFSGSAIFPVAVRMVYQVYENVKIPIIGMGGVATAEDVIEMMLAGASAVQVGAQNLVNPFACKEIIENLPKVMEKYKINSLKDIIGGAHNG